MSAVATPTPAEAAAALAAFHHVLDISLGPLMIAAWLNSMLVMLEWTQAYRYFKTYVNDGIVTKSAVVGALFIDFACSVFEYHLVYTECVTNWGNIDYITSPFLPWPTAAITTSTTLTTMIVQFYLIWRVGKLMAGDSKFKKYLVVSVLYLGVIIGFGGSLWAGITILTVPLKGNETKLRGSAITSIVSSAATDFLIAAAYVWKLVSLRRGHTVDSTAQGRSSSIISRLIFGSIKTGTATATVSVLALVLFFTLPSISTVNTGFIFILGRISTLTLLTNLNRREGLGLLSVTPMSNPDYATGAGVKASRLFRSGPLSTAGGVHVTNTTTIHLDGGATDAIRMVPIYEKGGMSRSGDDF